MLLEDLSLKTQRSNVNFLSSLTSGVFAAAYDEKVEWVVVEGVASFFNQTQPSSSEWMSFASTMAASVVAKMISDPGVFKEWPHCNQGKLHYVKSGCLMQLYVKYVTNNNNNNNNSSSSRDSNSNNNNNNNYYYYYYYYYY